MPRYQCITCGKVIDPEKNEICPRCGTAVAPSALTRVERKQTAARLRAEGMTHYDDHCHEDDAWKGSYGAQAHRASVRSHEAELRAGYRAHSAADVTTRGAELPQKTRVQKSASKRFRDKVQKTPVLMLLVLFLPAILFFVIAVITAILRSIGGVISQIGLP